MAREPDERPEPPRDPAKPYDLTYRQGTRPGDRAVRIVPTYRGRFTRKGGRLVATEQGSTGDSALWNAIRWRLIGRPIPTERESEERVGVFKGLAVFASDNISSSAYATEEIMRVLALAGAGVLALTMPITIAGVAVLALVVASYQQTLRAYPNGGGSYIVASDNLGPAAGLIAAGALLTDYVLTVAVSVAAGVAAITSIAPQLFDVRVAIGVGCVVLICLGNLRGIRESATIFAAPTYVYLVAIFGLLAYGLFRFATNALPVYSAPADWQPQGIEVLGVLLIMRAFASGAVALTGVEAVSNGIPAFKPVEYKNAQVVLILMGSFFGAIFLGMSFLAQHIGILPDPSEQETVVSQLTRLLVGEGTPYHYLVQLSTAVLLVLAANTAFADFPRLSSILARDGFMPRQFAYRGERLAFGMGIVVLALLSSALIIGFGGSVTNLIPLYTIGVFVAFTLSQSGMVKHWWVRRTSERGWRIRLAFNLLGAIATAVVAIVVGVAKFALGAWMVLVLIPVLIAVMWGIHRHYRRVEDALFVAAPSRLEALSPIVVVPIGRLDRATLRALAVARALAAEIVVLHIASDPVDAARFESQIANLHDEGLRPVIVESPYRALGNPLLSYLDTLDREDTGRPITVVLSEYVPAHWWEWFLHNQLALRLKLQLFFRPNTTVIDVPFRFDRD
jgi:amino acid transporter